MTTMRHKVIIVRFVCVCVWLSFNKLFCWARYSSLIMFPDNNKKKIRFEKVLKI